MRGVRLRAPSPLPRAPAAPTRAPAPAPPFHSLQDGTETVFRVKPSTKMGKIKGALATRKGVQAGSIRFMYDGERVEDDQTPESVS